MKRWLYPTGIERDYLAALRKEATAPVERAIRDILLPAMPDIFQQSRQDSDPRDLPESTGWFEQLRQALLATLTAAEILPDVINALVRRFAARIETFNRREFDSVLRSVYGADTPPAAIRAALQSSRTGSDIEQAFRATLERSGVAQGEIDVLASRAFPATGEINRVAFRESMRRVLGVDVITNDAKITEALRVWESENIALVKSIPQVALSRLQGKITEAVRTGSTLKQVTDQIREEFGVTDNRAKLIARDQVGKLNGQLTQQRQVDQGIDSYTWRGVLDQRERPEHVAREGKLFKWSEPPSDGHPGQPIRCFPGSTRVAFAQGYDKLWRHWYEGALSSVVTADGVLLESTPNHPILSLRGWIPLGELQQGDHVVQAVAHPGLIKEINVDHVSPSFQDVFDSAEFLRSSFSRPAAEFDFHGDIPQHDVDVIDAAGCLADDVFSGQHKSQGKLTFTRADIDLANAVLDPKTARKLAGVRYAGAVFPKCVIRLGCQRLALLIAQARHAQQIGLSAGSDRKLRTSDNSLDGGPSHAVIFRQLQNASAICVGGHDGGFVEIGSTVVCWVGLSGERVDASQAERLAEIVRAAGQRESYILERCALAYKPLRVVEKSRREFSGPVFNAETAGGWYMVGHNAIVSHNCRCTAEPVLPSWEELERRVTGVAPPAGTYD